MPLRIHGRRSIGLPVFCVLVALSPVRGALAAGPDELYSWNLPKGFPRPRVPAANPMSTAKVELGKHLFYDPRMSSNSKTSCATCHRQELAFTDGKAVALGTTGEKHPRGSMSLVNVAYQAVLTWSNPQVRQLEQQALVPMLGEHPVELQTGSGDRLPAILRSDRRYQVLFQRAFPGETNCFTIANATKAIASFERSIVSARSPWDRYHFGGDETAVSAAAKRGEILFFSAQLSCFRCHGGFTFGSGTVSDRHDSGEIEFHNTGLYNLAGSLSYPAANTGTFEFTKAAKDVGAFKAPTLRNIAVTAPYMHDGSVGTLDQVLDHYAAGGRTITSGPYSGVGKNNPNKDPLIGGFTLTTRDRQDLLEFLRALTDDQVLRDPHFANPW